MNRRFLGRVAVLLLLWLAVAVPATAVVFANSSTSTVVAGHTTVVRPTFDGYATLDLGPFLPNLRYPTAYPLGANLDFGRTTLSSYDTLIQRYALIGSQPEGEIAKVIDALRGLATDAVVSGALVGLTGPALWLLLGRQRRAQLFQHVTARRLAAAGVAVLLLTAAVAQPWNRFETTLEQPTAWRPIEEALPDVAIPERARPLEVEVGLFTSGTKRIFESMLSSYRRSLEFYDEATAAVPSIADQLHTPAEDETVAVLVSDRHDNVGMDRVARAIGDAAGATILLDAGDDTSTGSPWEAFSLDSLDRVFEDYEHRYAIAGNHDHGDFVGTYLGELGFERFEGGDAADGPDDIRLLGADDPRSSGLGSWRDETALSFDQHAQRVADRACEYDAKGERISTLLVHDANTGQVALDRGCVDLVVAGHLHERLGPTRVEGANGKVGYTYTTGTTGGAAYAVAIGSKIRRNAMVSLVTYREGRPVGLQPVTLRTVGDFQVGPYLPLELGPDETEGAQPQENGPTESSSPGGRSDGGGGGI